MTNVLYIGNALSQSGKTASAIDILGHNLQEFCKVNIVSNKQSKVLRLLDMIGAVWHNRRKTDVVLIDTYSTTNFYFALVVSQLCRILKLPYIPILHGGNLENRLKNHPKKSALVFKYAKCLVAPSRYFQTKFKAYGYPKVVYIPNTIELADYNFKDRPINEFRLLWVRSFTEFYNPLLALKVLDSLREKGHKAKLIMVGPERDGSLEQCKAMAKEKGLNVTFTGLLTKMEWINHSENCNIFLNTTTVDNTPVSVIEAMALGLPVVSTDVGGLPYLITNEQDGLLVSPNSVEAMVSAILRLKHDDNLRHKLVKAARHKVKHFDWPVIKSQWKDLLS